MDVFKALVEQTSFDSAALGGSSAVVHRFAQQGPFQATVLRNGVSVRSVGIRIGLPPSPGPAAPGQAPHLDLAHLAGGTSPETIEVAQGYALFHAPAGEKDHAVTVQRTDGGEAFDSRELGSGDVFAALVLRPGRYAMKNTLNNTQASLTVSYPVVGPTPYRPPDAFSVDADDGGFTPSTITLRPGQGLAIHIKTRARITIDLVAPDDGPRPTT